MAGTFTLDDGQRDGPWDELIGRTAGSYRIVRLLGKGGMGSVYLARHPGIGAEVAVKFLHPRFAGDRGQVERFFNEARAVNLIGHENIVKTLDFAVTPDGRYYFVMEHLSGQPLSTLSGKPVPLAVAGPILMQCCRALQAAHERQIVHRDLKPDNIFLISQMGKKNFVKLVDFGIAKLTDPDGGRGMTEAGALIGTPAYMSPEQAAGRSAEVGRRSDVYSLGVVMFELATGRVPFAGASTAETLVLQMQSKAPAPRSIEPSVPEAYEKIILKALEKKKEDRWQSMAELHDAILGCLRDLGLSLELPAADPEPSPRPPGQMPETDPARPEPPLTGTFAGDRAPLEARVTRFGDWAFAPARRLRTVGALVLGVVAIVLLVPRQRPATVAPAPKPAPAAAAPRTTPPAVAPGAATSAAAPGAAPAVHKGPDAQKPVQSGPARPADAVSVASTAPARRKPVVRRTPKALVNESPKPVNESVRPAPAPNPEAPAGPGAPADANAPTTAADAARLMATARKEREAAKSARADMLAAAAKAAHDDAAASTPPPGVKLFIASDPLGASVTAAWNGKSAAGTTPVVFRVRRGATVTVTFAKPGYVPEVRELSAGSAQAVAVELRPTP